MHIVHSDPTYLQSSYCPPPINPPYVSLLFSCHFVLILFVTH